MVGTETNPPTKKRFGVEIVETWRNIAEVLGKGVRTVKYYAQLGDDRLPVQRDRSTGRVWVRYDQLMEWADRRGILPSAKPGKAGQS